MGEIKEAIIYTRGDSNNLATWSNVPYFFCKELENRGIKVNRVNISFDKNSNNLAKFHYYLARLKRILIILLHGNKKTIWKFDYTKFYEDNVCKMMLDATSKYPDADFGLAFSLSYAIDSEIPFFMCGDWTIDYHLEHKYARKPFKIEKKLIKNQYKMMNKAQAIISLIPESANSIGKHFKDKTYYFGTGVNGLKAYQDYSNIKAKSNNILFIGNNAYRKGLEKLIEVLKQCEKSYHLDVIGMNSNDISNANENCSFYGYLNKSDEKQCEKYYEIMNSAKLVVNISDKWNAISSLLEALYYGTPIVISRNVEVERVLGKDLASCVMCDENESIRDVAIKIDKLMSTSLAQYSDLAKQAHEITKNHEWQHIVDEILKLIKNCEERA